MRTDPLADSELAERLAVDGVALVPGVVPAAMVAALAAAADEAVAAEARDFPPGDDQHGRVLFAPSHGGAFLELCGFDPFFEPIEALVGDDSIIYTMTTSVLAPGSSGPIDRYHVDLAPDRPAGVALAGMVLLDRFDERTGGTEFLVGSHLWGDRPTDDTLRGRVLVGEPGDVCYFDPRIHHRSTTNTTGSPRRAVLVQMVRPWMKQRVDVRAMLAGVALDQLPRAAVRRLGLTSLPPRSAEEFIQRRADRPWS